MSNDKHTPTPWKINEEQDLLVLNYDSSIVASADSKWFTDNEAKANAARIVQCVNEYDGLIETIATLRAEKAELIQALRGMLDIVKESRGVDGFHANEDIAEWDEFHEVHKASQTLAKYETK